MRRLGQAREGTATGRRRWALATAALLPMLATAAPPANAQGPAIGPVKPRIVRVNSPSELNCVLRSQFQGRVVVPAGSNWKMVGDDDCNPDTPNDKPLTYIPVQANVELVGERGQLGVRPRLLADYRDESYPLFAIERNDIRIEGLHIVGPYSPRDRKKSLSGVAAVRILVNPRTLQGRRIVIADNEIQGFTNAVAVNGAFSHDEPRDYDFDPACERAPQRCPHLDPSQADLVRVERNYLHNNAMKGGGYGVVVGGGAYVTVEGNVFEYNNHSIASDGRAYSGYMARFNYVLRGLLTNHSGNWPHYFDIHGTGAGSSGSQHEGGRAGTRFEIVLNTFRGDLDYAIKLRGTPTDGVYFQGNVLAHDDRGDAIDLTGGARRMFASGNDYDADFSSDLATGDFDGDGRSDVFVANGTAWFFSRAGRRPWEFLHASTKRLSELGVADIDNDRVSDVLYRDGAGRIGYLRGGRGNLVPLASPAVPVPMRDLRFGDFDGDGLTDIFYTRARQWYVWYGATRAWRPTASSGKAVGDLLFGDFDDTHGTDVATVLGSGWAYSSGSTTAWRRLNRRLTGSFAGAVAADVDGTPKSDIVFGGSDGWRYSRDGRGPLTALRRGDGGVNQQRVGRFDGGQRQGIVSFGYRPYRDRLGRWMPLGGGTGFVRHSAENMR